MSADRSSNQHPLIAISEKVASYLGFASNTFFVSIIIPVWAYAATYGYEFGYNSFFGLPPFLISITLEKIAHILTIPILYLLLIILFLFVLFDRETKSHVIPVLLIGLLVGLPLLIILFELEQLGIVLLIVLTFFVLLLAAVVVSYVHAKLTKTSFIIKDHKKAQSFQNQIADAALLMFVVVLTPLLAAMVIGQQTASAQESFVVITQDDSTYLIVNSVGENLIGVKTEDNKLTGDYLVAELARSQFSSIVIKGGLKGSALSGTVGIREQFTNAVVQFTEPVINIVKTVHRIFNLTPKVDPVETSIM